MIDSGVATMDRCCCCFNVSDSAERSVEIGCLYSLVIGIPCDKLIAVGMAEFCVLCSQLRRYVQMLELLNPLTQGPFGFCRHPRVVVLGIRKMDIDLTYVSILLTVA